MFRSTPTPTQKILNDFFSPIFSKAEALSVTDLEKIRDELQSVSDKELINFRAGLNANHKLTFDKLIKEIRKTFPDANIPDLFQQLKATRKNNETFLSSITDTEFYKKEKTFAKELQEEEEFTEGADILEKENSSSGLHFKYSSVREDSIMESTLEKEGSISELSDEFQQSFS